METRMELVEDWQTRHERACAQRWGTLIKLIGGGGGAVVALMLAIAAWGLNKTWDGQQEQMRVLHTLVAQGRAPPG